MQAAEQSAGAEDCLTFNLCGIFGSDQVSSNAKTLHFALKVVWIRLFFLLVDQINLIVHKFIF